MLRNRIEILFSLTLLSLLFVSSSFSQSESVDSPKLLKKAIPLKTLRPSFAGKDLKRNKSKLKFNANSLKIQTSVSRMLSKDGKVEFDSTEDRLLVSDTKRRMGFVKEYIEVLNSSGLSLGQLFSSESAESTRAFSLTLRLENLDFLSDCGPGIGETRRRRKLTSVFIHSIQDFLSTEGVIEISVREKIVVFEDERWRVDLVEKIAKLFNRTFDRS